MTDLCKMLGIKKLNTTAYHPECDSMVERFNRILKTSLHKHAATYENQWDQYLYGMLYAYRNTPHESMGEKSSYLCTGWIAKRHRQQPSYRNLQQICQMSVITGRK